ncbi:LOW QUALITY PROTEIN: E3 ubiquitin-protein ligase MSL2-like [Synchiropus picturatus]
MGNCRDLSLTRLRVSLRSSVSSYKQVTNNSRFHFVFMRDVSCVFSRDVGPPLVYVNLQLRRDSDAALTRPSRAQLAASPGAHRSCCRAPAAPVSAPRPQRERRAPERGAACSRTRILLQLWRPTSPARPAADVRTPGPAPRGEPSLSRTSVPTRLVPPERVAAGAACRLRADDDSVPDRTRTDVRAEDGSIAVQAARHRLLVRRSDLPPLDCVVPGVPARQASEMNPVNATSLYVSASRSALQCDPADPRALAELCKLLPFFRQSVSCLVCGNLLQEPVAPVDSSCQHSVCRGCRGQRMQLKPSCSWCKDQSGFQENRQLSLLVRCYRTLCRYITQSPLAPHVASAACSSPDLQAVLDEGLGAAAEDQPHGSEESRAPDEPALNGLHDCNGVLGPEGGFTQEVPLCVRAALGEELKHGSEPLLLSVEEVLRTLDTEPEPDPATPPAFPGPRCPPLTPSSQLSKSTAPELGSPQALPRGARTPPPPRCRRKRSRSESDSEKVQPLPISSLLQGSSPVLTHPQDPKFPAPSQRPHLAPVPNGGCPKVGKTVLISSKNLKKTVEHHGGAKKVCAKARQGGAKPRPQSHERLLPHALTHPPSPSKPQYKKPVEKKGCKCGRATQNPSVLTCRGQRCPCYSNRKACLDCICRGCQNSYMANGEKKLEAFAVPEKALEQTRLTLGINLTSIAAAALRSPSSASPANALLNVAAASGPPVAPSFLSGAGHDGFEDSLEMRFDC